MVTMSRNKVFVHFRFSISLMIKTSGQYINEKTLIVSVCIIYIICVIKLSTYKSQVTRMTETTRATRMTGSYDRHWGQPTSLIRGRASRQTSHGPSPGPANLPRSLLPPTSVALIGSQLGAGLAANLPWPLPPQAAWPDATHALIHALGL